MASECWCVVGRLTILVAFSSQFAVFMVRPFGGCATARVLGIWLYSAIGVFCSLVFWPGVCAKGDSCNGASIASSVAGDTQDVQEFLRKYVEVN